MAKTRQPNLDLRRERFAQQMTRSALSDRTGISRKTLISVESRRSRVRLDTASRIAKALDRDVSDLFDMAEVIG
jgi:DNA-binding XRE family transcriptional regulator